MAVLTMAECGSKSESYPKEEATVEEKAEEPAAEETVEQKPVEEAPADYIGSYSSQLEIIGLVMSIFWALITTTPCI